VIIDESRKR